MGALLCATAVPLLSSICAAYAAVPRQVPEPTPTKTLGPGDPDFTPTDLPTDIAQTPGSGSGNSTGRPTPTTLPEYLDNDNNIKPIDWEDPAATYLGMKTLVLYKDATTLTVSAFSVRVCARG